MIQFIREIKSKIEINVPLLEEAIIFATDTKELFIDVNYNRIQINDISIVDTVSDLDNILTPLSNKFYFCQEDNVFYKYIDGTWVGVTATQEQYQELLKLYGYIVEERYIQCTLIAGNWNGNTYTINNNLFIEEATVKLYFNNLTEEQLTALEKAMISADDSDIANNNLILKATGIVPTVDIPIIITVNINANSFISIEDHLRSTSSVNPLAANQGRVLNNKIGDLNLLNVTNKDDAVSAVNDLYILSR